MHCGPSEAQKLARDIRNGFMGSRNDVDVVLCPPFVSIAAVREIVQGTTLGLGAQNAIMGGGRYDGLVEELGGPAMPGFGFAVGMERLISLLPETGDGRDEGKVFLVALGGRASERLAIAQLVHDTLEAMNPQYPEPEFDPGEYGPKSLR